MRLAEPLPLPGHRMLAFDTSGPWCSAALCLDGAIRHRHHIDMARGQAEALMPMLGAVLAADGAGWSDLGAIAVGVGPGNFTGIRISVAAARGLALGLTCPAIGVSLFEVLGDTVAPADGGAKLCSIQAPRGLAYVQLLRDGVPEGPPQLIDPSAPPPGLALTGAVQVIGHRAEEVARPFGLRWIDAAPADIAARIALVAARRLHSGARQAERPAPLYVRPADAAPPREAPVPILP